MQDRYAGDVGDFGKYGLLRFLCDGNQGDLLKLAVVWYLTSCSSKANDGKHLGFLKDQKGKYRCCDEQLFDELRKLLLDANGNHVEGRRRIEFIEKSRIFPTGTTFFTAPLCFDAKTLEGRSEERRSWMRNALNETKNADLVFLDPDNGVECLSASATAPSKGPKYTFWNEILGFAKPDRSLVIYHHLNRSQEHEEQVKTLHCEFKKRISGFTTRALIFKRGTGRAYFIVMSPEHEPYLSTRILKFVASSWKEHFREIVCA